MKRRVGIAILGTKLDAGMKEQRWNKWRPTVGMCQQPGLFIDDLHLLVDTHSDALFKQVTADIGEVAPATEIHRHAFNARDPWDFEEVYSKLLAVIENEIVFKPEQEDVYVSVTTGTHVAQICLFLLVEARFIPSAKLIQLSPPKRGSDVPEAVGRHTVIDLDLSRYNAITTRFAVERLASTSVLKGGIATRNRTFNTMIDEIERVAINSRAPVLLTGPTGAGKSQLASKIYELRKKRAQVSGQFIEVNCATLRGDQAMSALFGHRKGAFTGALADRPGLMKAADKGMLFLDEIAELGADEQAMCLRAIEEKRFLPLGSDRDVSSDFLLIAGTNKDLGKEVRAGRFREDLYARLNLWTFALPALRDRVEDIEPNLDHELDRFSIREGRKVGMTREARELFLSFATSPAAAWSANFRDLTASTTRMATLAPKGRIDEDTVKSEIRRLKALWAVDLGGDSLEELLGNRAAEIDPFDRVQLAHVVDVCRRHRTMSAAGRELFAVSRGKKASSNDTDRVRKYLARFDLAFEDLAG